MAQPFLSICMPVYNGSLHLKEALDSITDQFSDPEVLNNVEVICCDDGSRDNSLEILKSYQERFSNIKILVNEKNLGFDRNVNKVLTEGKGKFCWVLSQDELLVPGSLKLLVELLLANPEVAYVCISNNPNKAGEKDAQFFRDGTELLGTLGMKGGLLSQNIYNREFLPADREKYYGNLWFHYSMALEIIAKRPLFFVKNLFVPTDHKTAWAKGGLAFYTFTNLRRIILNLPYLGYSEKVIKDQLKGFARDLPRTMASAKLHSLPYKMDVVKILFKDFYKNPAALCLALGIFLTPVFLLRFVKNLGILKLN